MHSLGLAQDLLRAVLGEAAQHDGRHVRSIHVTLGHHDFTEAESVQFCLEALSQGTLADGAEIRVASAQSSLRCADCEGIFETENPANTCPSCGQSALTMIQEADCPSITIRLG